MVPFLALQQGGVHSWFSYKGRMVPFLVLLKGKEVSILGSPTRKGLFHS